jgi:hypothetical protein
MSPAVDLGQVRQACDVAARWHRGQTRRSGDPYVTHSFAVGAIVANLGLGTDAVCAAILHDLINDTPYTYPQLCAEFRPEIATIVHRLSNHAELCQAMDAVATQGVWSTSDFDLLVVKLADRLHNMRTLQYLPVGKQIRRSRETLELVAPVAHRLGLLDVKRELEGLALGILRPSPITDRATMVWLRLLGLTALLLPRQVRARWREEWSAEIGVLRTRRERMGYAIRVLLGVPRLAWILGRAEPSTAHRGLSLARIASALGLGSALIAVAAPGPVLAWVAGGVALAALGLIGAILFARSDAPVRRLVDVIRAWRR